MAKLVDPDSLIRDTEIVFDTALKTIQLCVAGNLNDDPPGQSSGVTLQCVYSKCKELWKSQSDLNMLRFPFDAITEAKMDLVNGWDWKDDQTRCLVRDGGWSLRDSGGVSTEEYACIISLGNFAEVTDQAYYQQAAGFNETPADFDKTGVLNEAIKTYGDATHGDFDYRNFLKAFLRVQAKLYGQYSLLVEQGLAALDYTVYRLPLSNTGDIKVTHDDAYIDANLPYTGMTIDFLKGVGFTTWENSHLYPANSVVQELTGSPKRWFRTDAGGTSAGTDVDDDSGVVWYAYPGERQIGASWYAFNRIVDGNVGTLEEIYEFCQRELRQTININDDVGGDAYGTIKGVLAVPLSGFLGDTLQSNPGVYIDDFDPNDTNRIELFDITVDGGGVDAEGKPVTSTKRLFPFVAAGTIIFNQELLDDPDVIWKVYFDDLPGGADYDTVNAVIVNDDDGNPLEGSNPAGSVPFTFDYDGNVQGGRTPGADAVVDIVAIGLGGAQFIVAQFTITRATGLTFPVNAAKERNYSNPA